MSEATSTAATALEQVLLEPAMPALSPGAAPTWASAVWVGAVDDDLLLAGRQTLADAASYRTARLMVRSGRIPRGFIEVPIEGGRLDLAAAEAAIALLPAARRPPTREDPPISVVLCTLDRPQMLTAALDSLLRLQYSAFEVIVVDNNPASGATAEAVRRFDDRRIRLIAEPRRGLARARNTGALAALNPIVAFTDDDVAIDPFWLQGIADGFAADSDVACVSGIVPSGEIGSVAQAYFDRRVSWARSCAPELFALSQVRPTEPLFPFHVGRYGTGANFALRREVLLALGGFDEGLGVGSKAGGGEDIDMFVRVILAGHSLAYEPSAVVWHRHRLDLDSLRSQIQDYGTGLGAWLTKLALHPRSLRLMLRRARPGLRHLRTVTQVDLDAAALPADVDRLWRLERNAVLYGPLALARSRMGGAKARPLHRPNRPRFTDAANPPWVEQR
jgi:glycosyltransferase involved in cell wall biosynthesis